MKIITKGKGRRVEEQEEGWGNEECNIMQMENVMENEV